MDYADFLQIEWPRFNTKLQEVASRISILEKCVCLVIQLDTAEQLTGAQYATREEWKNNSRKNEEMEPKQIRHPGVDVMGDGSKEWFCKEQYCIGTWNVRSMNQGKLEVVKQEMARMNTNIVVISELKWTGMGNFNSNDHYIHYCGQKSLRRNEVALIVNKSPKCSTWVQS